MDDVLTWDMLELADEHACISADAAESMAVIDALVCDICHF